LRGHAKLLSPFTDFSVAPQLRALLDYVFIRFG
jgi:hypothetical protein